MLILPFLATLFTAVHGHKVRLALKESSLEEPVLFLACPVFWSI